MSTLVLLLLLIGSVVVIVATLRGSKKKELPAELPRRELAPGMPHPMTLRAGDVVSIAGEDWIVKDEATYWQGEDNWREYTLESGPKTRFLSVEEDDEIEMTLTEKVRDLPMTEEPSPTLDYQGQRFRMSQKGWAVYARGRAKEGVGDQCQFFDYVGSDGAVLSVEQWGEHEFEVSVGHEVPMSDVTIYPGS